MSSSSVSRNRIAQSINTEKFPFRISSFGNAVGIETHDLSRAEHELRHGNTWQLGNDTQPRTENLDGSRSLRMWVNHDGPQMAANAIE
jgi:hypothetical protein